MRSRDLKEIRGKRGWETKNRSAGETQFHDSGRMVRLSQRAEFCGLKSRTPTPGGQNSLAAPKRIPPRKFVSFTFTPMKSQQRWKARRGLSSFSCCAILLPLNSAKTVTNSLPASLSQSIRTLSLV